MTRKEIEKRCLEEMQQTIPDHEALWQKIEAQLPPQDSQNQKASPIRMQSIRRFMTIAACLLVTVTGAYVLTRQSGMENAVKHGVTKKRGGGSVTISTRRTEAGICITVADTGVGFDPDNYMEDGKPHVGIRNVRERLQHMMGGTLSVTSTEQGTVAVVTIPAKEANK